ncbi:hypothetical protein IFM89_039101 [Coptis chinensis]|uniref:Uncharacterized protein n=1 Tax=Coptis chinensis TaxID=261450 RepID=A0A835IKA7_9MAGN|nr:hypothetical protein IFM89_039101 [Coptis chinensis]
METNSRIWDEIERSESYLVCCMFEKAASLATCVLKRILITSIIEDTELDDMMESAGMVLVQSLKELGRTSEILNELRNSFGSVTNVPIQLLLTGACFQISDGSHSGLCEFLEEFLGKWKYVDGESYILANASYFKGCNGESVLAIDKYLDVVEIYAVTLLGEKLNNTDLAITWVEKAELPDEKRQASRFLFRGPVTGDRQMAGFRQRIYFMELLRRLISLYSPKATNSSLTEEARKSGSSSYSGMESTAPGAGETSRTSKVKYPHNGGDNRKQTTFKFTERVESCLWWFRTVSLKFGSVRLVISHGKIVLWSSFIIFICYVLQKKRATLRRMASRQALTVKKALVDMWQLAFSVQVNPLAAIEPLPAGTRGSRG